MSDLVISLTGAVVSLTGFVAGGSQIGIDLVKDKVHESSGSNHMVRSRTSKIGIANYMGQKNVHSNHLLKFRPEVTTHNVACSKKR